MSGNAQAAAPTIEKYSTQQPVTAKTTRREEGMKRQQKKKKTHEGKSTAENPCATTPHNMTEHNMPYDRSPHDRAPHNKASLPKATFYWLYLQVIQHHMAELDEPRTGGGLRSHRR